MVRAVDRSVKVVICSICTPPVATHTQVTDSLGLYECCSLMTWAAFESWLVKLTNIEISTQSLCVFSLVRCFDMPARRSICTPEYHELDRSIKFTASSETQSCCHSMTRSVRLTLLLALGDSWLVCPSLRISPTMVYYRTYHKIEICYCWSVCPLIFTADYTLLT